MVEEKAYCRYQGEHSQRYLEATRLNWTMRGGSGGEGEQKRKKRGSRDQETKRNKLAGLYRELGEGKGSSVGTEGD